MQKLWLQTIKYSHKAVHKLPHVAFLCLGITSGIPFLLVLGTLSYWMAELSMPAHVIGAMGWVTLPYSFKMFLSFILRIPSPFFKILDERRGWYISTLLLMTICLIGIAHLSPLHHTYSVAFLGFIVCMCASIQDTIVDHLRIEWRQRMNASFECIGFRFGMFISGAGALYLSHYWGWKNAYIIVAIIALLFGSTVFFLDAKPYTMPTFRIVWNSLWGFRKIPFVFLIICFFKSGDVAMNAMLSPFLYDLGVDKLSFANLTKTYGLLFIVLGSFSVNLYSFKKMIHMSFILQIFSTLSFAYMGTYMGKVAHLPLSYLNMIVSIENFTSGFVNATFILYLSKLCESRNNMVVFSVLYAFSSFSRIMQSHMFGIISSAYGWGTVFVISTIIIIGCYMIFMRSDRTDKIDKKFFS